MKKILISLLGILIFVGCGNNKDVKLDLEKVEIELNNLEYESNTKLFEENIKMENDKLTDKYGMDISLFEEILVSTSKNLETASMYAIFLPKKGKEADCEEEINNFFEKYEQSWMMGYFPEEEKLVKNRSNEKYGNYYIYVISKDNDKVIEKIKNIK